jgi:hypothetical protein
MLVGEDEKEIVHGNVGGGEIPHRARIQAFSKYDRQEARTGSFDTGVG